jgi:electron transfer flavoprotein alpha subunit
MNKILIIAEHNGIEINSSTSKCVSCAANIPDSQIDIAVFAKNGDELANQASKYVIQIK